MSENEHQLDYEPLPPKNQKKVRLPGGARLICGLIALLFNGMVMTVVYTLVFHRLARRELEELVFCGLFVFADVAVVYFFGKMSLTGRDFVRYTGRS